MEQFFLLLINSFKSISLSSIVDIFIVALIFFEFYCLIRDSRAKQLLQGILLILLLIPISYIFKFNMIYFLLSKTITVGLLVIVIIFQPEIRRILEQIGRRSFEEFPNSKDLNLNNSIVSSILKSCNNLAKNKIGALLVVQKTTGLSDIIETGIILNAEISSSLIENIFIPNTPLHDGAVIIKNDKIIASACFLPLSNNPNLDTTLGTRHRAALGLSEVSDSIVIIISEETGRISLAKNGKLEINISTENLKEDLLSVYELNLTNKYSNERSNSIWKKINIWKK